MFILSKPKSLAEREDSRRGRFSRPDNLHIVPTNVNSCRGVMRIVVCINEPAASSGGAQRLAVALASDQGGRFEVCGTRDDVDILMRAKGWISRLRLLGKPIDIVRLMNRLFVDFITIVRLANAADVTVVFNFHSLLPWVTVAIRRTLLVVPLYHGSISGDDGGRCTRKFLLIMRRYLLGRASAVVCVSRSERQALESDYPSVPQIHVVTPPVGFSGGNNGEPEQLWIDAPRH